MAKDHRDFLVRLEYKLAKFAIRNLMLIIVGAMIIVYIAELFTTSTLGQSLTPWLVFDRDAVFRGEVWRLFTFLLIPPDSGLIFTFFELYLYYIFGKALEDNWGTTRFNLFYFTGAIATLIIGLITGYASNVYLDGSIFLAFAILFPDFRLYLLFIFPVKIKWFAILTVILNTLAFIIGGWLVRAVILITYANVLLFFHADIAWHFRRLTSNARLRQQRQASRDRWNKK